MTTEPTTPAPPTAPEPERPKWVDLLGSAPEILDGRTFEQALGREPAPDAGRDTVREAIAGAARTVPLRLGPNAIRMAEAGHPIVLNLSEADAVADEVMAALDAGNLERAAEGSSKPAIDLNHGLRERYADAMRAHYLSSNRDEADADGNSPCVCADWREPGCMGTDEEDWDSHLADAVLAVRDGEMERLRAKVARLTSDLAETAGLEETAADRYQNALHWQERAEEAEAKLTAVDAELDRIANLSTVTADDGRADKFATGARWTLRMILTALTAPHGPAGQGDDGGGK